MAKQSSTAKKFISKRMKTFKKGQMHARTKKTGPVVKDKKQAIAIALSEARRKGMKTGTPQPTRDTMLKRMQERSLNA